MKMMKLLPASLLLVALSAGTGSCTYSNDDNPNVYPTPEPAPDPEPEPEPGVNERYLEAAYSANCFLVKPGRTVDIPILKAYAMWDLWSGELGGDGFAESTPEPVLLWQDSPDLIAGIGLVPGRTNEESSIAVSTADRVGNAVVAVRIGGAIRWSWHLWVTRYDPNAELVAYGKIYTWDNNGDGQPDYTFMDRNLGALLDKAIPEPTETDSLAVCGLLYQWGRKDPFPGDHGFRHSNRTDYDYFESQPIYNAAGERLVEAAAADGTGIRSIRTDADLTRTNLAKSVLEPMTFLLGTGSYGNWYDCAEPVKMRSCDTLWCEPVRGKSPFDPCPEGWRVPADRNNLSVWNGLDRATTDYSPLGVFPYAGFRYRNGGGCLKNSGFGAYLWSGTPPQTGNASELSIYVSPSEQRPIIRSDVSCRSDGLSVRCVKVE